jgi:hypothetical protein
VCAKVKIGGDFLEQGQIALGTSFAVSASEKVSIYGNHRKASAIRAFLSP